MKLDPTQRQIVADEITKAHGVAMVKGSFRSREVAADVVARLEDMERFGHPWVRQYLRSLAISGAMKACADWRRIAQRPARTKRGKVVSLPAFSAGTDQQGRPVQMRLADMTPAELEAKRDRMARTRDTYSTEVAAYDAVLAFMAEHGHRTVGDALAAMERAA